MTPASQGPSHRSFSGRRGLLVQAIVACAAAVALLTPAVDASADASLPAQARAVATAAPLQSGALAAAPLTSAEAVVSLASDPVKAAGNPGKDDGRRTFGVQPSGPKKPDARANFTFRDMTPGQVLHDYVAFVNISLQPVTLQVYPADAFNTVEGGFDLKRPTQKQTDLGSWISLRRGAVTVPARSAFITPIELHVPANAEPGDHAAGIVASMKTTQTNGKGAKVVVDQRVGTRFYVRIKGTLHPRVDITRRDATFHLLANPLTGNTDVTYTVTNTGNVRLEGRRSIRVSSLLGLSAQADVPGLPELLPGGSFTFTQKVTGVVPTFLNTAFVTIDPTSVSGNVDPALAQAVARRDFFALSIPGVVLLLLLIGGGAWWWRRRRRNRPKAESTWTDQQGKGRTGPCGAPQVAPSATSSEGAGVSARMASARRGSVRRPGVALGALLLAGVAFGATILPAPIARAAASDGTLTFIPGDASTAVPLFVATSGPCPKQAVGVIGRMYGKGLPADGKVVVPNESKPVNHDKAFGAPLQDNLINFAREEGLQHYVGTYTITLQCIDENDLTVYAQFTGTLSFKQPDVYHGPIPSKPPAGLTDGVLAMVFPEYKQKILGQAKANAQAQQSEAGGRAGSVAPASDGGAGANSKLHLSVVGPVAGGLLALVFLAGAGYLVTRRRAEPLTVSRGSAKAEWPEDRTDRTTGLTTDRTTGRQTGQAAPTTSRPKAASGPKPPQSNGE